METFIGIPNNLYPRNPSGQFSVSLVGSAYTASSTDGALPIDKLQAGDSLTLMVTVPPGVSMAKVESTYNTTSGITESINGVENPVIKYIYPVLDSAQLKNSSTNVQDIVGNTYAQVSQQVMFSIKTSNPTGILRLVFTYTIANSGLYTPWVNAVNPDTTSSSSSTSGSTATDSTHSAAESNVLFSTAFATVTNIKDKATTFTLVVRKGSTDTFLAYKQPIPMGSFATFDSVVCSPDEKILLINSADCTIRVETIQTLKETPDE